MRLACGLACASFLVFGLASPVLASRVSGSPEVSSLDVPANPAFTQQVQPSLIARLKELRVPGAVVFVENPLVGNWTAAFGTSNLATNAPISADMHFRIGSITKTFTSTVILQLIDEGRLRLDDTIGKFRWGIPNGNQITIRQLLNMTSGLYNYSEDQDFVKMLNSELRGVNPGRVWTPRELLAIAFKHANYFAPGKGYHYSNTNYIILGQLIEQITGRAARLEIQRRIFAKLGMLHSVIPALNERTLPAPYTLGYTYESLIKQGQVAAASLKPLEVTQVNPSWEGTAGDAISTLRDLKIWIKALVKGTLISPDLQKERLTFVPPETDGPRDVGYGLGIANFGGFIGHNGALPGFQSFAAYSPVQDTTVIVLTNLEPLVTGTQAADQLAKIIIQKLRASSRFMPAPLPVR